MATAAALTLFAPGAAHADPGPLYNSAQENFTEGDEAAGLADLRQLLAESPDDTHALSLQAIWSDFTGDFITREIALNRLQGLDPKLADGTRTVFRAVGAGVGTLPNPIPAIAGPQTGIAVCGYGLLPDGSMRPELVNRLQAAWLQAIASPMSPILVSGGNPQNGITEAAAMQGWLIGHGIPASRIVADHRAGSTVQNALFGTALLREAGATSAIVVTSPNHIRRAVSDFIVAGMPVVGATTSLEQLVSQLPPPARQHQRGIYLDATRTLRLPTER
ncbi:YdcF family protein [Nocardia yamanashiensis]|uniref:YdcF family protein n=1 Tax=Nocardia yamanashiensis TaxID=209247 RepID=UPI001E2906D7|nr:YdcF family protein [Nocardia yamanashiensis]UGT44412.1 YdcF family protein [Nocardia yamanashiensis]